MLILLLQPLKLNGKPKISPEIEKNKKTEVKEETKPKVRMTL